jgi:hypothetical protein
MLGQHLPEPYKRPHDFNINCTARGLRSTLESIATPCSVKARGRYRLPPQLEVTNCDLKLEAPHWSLKFSNSSGVSWNMKSSGNLSMLRLTAWLKTFVGTP